MALLVVEGVGVCLGSVVGVLLVLRSLMAHRASLCSVFLGVPNVALRTLASKSTNIGDEDEESDDGKCGSLGFGLPSCWAAVGLRFMLCIGHGKGCV